MVNFTYKFQGQGIRQGLCDNTCERLYQSCRFDLFSYDTNHPDRLVPCKRDTLFCSKLQDITADYKKFCALLGHKINTKTQYDDNFLMSLASNQTIEPVCYDMTPGSAIWGRIPPSSRNSADSLKINSILLVIISVIFTVFWF